MTTAAPLARFDVSADDIDRVVAVFYALIRAHDVLGPVFAARIAAADWPAHEAKIAAFWRNAILREKSYSGNPMRVHVSTPEVQPEHFPLWLGLFAEVLKAELPDLQARAWMELAHRIGEGFRTGLVAMRQPKDQPPKLF